MELHSVNLLDMNTINKIRIKTYSWEEIMNSKLNLYDLIIDFMLDRINLFYYASQTDSTRTLIDTKAYVTRLVECDLIKIREKDIFNCIGWGTASIDINNTRFQGDFAEYLMNILVDRFTNSKTLISKVSVKTSPRVSAYGNDNIYYDYENEILYFGESKFYSDTKVAIDKAIESLNEHNDIEEISFIRNHTTEYIAEDQITRTKIVEKLEMITSEDIKINSLFFIMNDDIYDKKDYERLIIEKFTSEDDELKIPQEIIMIFFPILSKSELLERFKERIEKYE